MQDIHRILFATDFSECSKPAQTLACSLAEKFSAELHLINVVSDPAVFALDPTAMPIEAVEQMLSDRIDLAAAELAKMPRDGWKNDKPIVRVTRQGLARDEIVDYAKEANIDLIVLGTHGRSGFRRLMLGSVAENVIRMAECPVLTVRAPE